MYRPGGEPEATLNDAEALQPLPQHEPSPGPSPAPAAPLPAKAAAVSTLALAVAACGGGSGTSTGGGTPPPVSTVRKPQSDAEAARFLLQASLSASTGAITDLRSEGYEPWLDRQMGIANDQSGREFLAARGFDRVDANRFYDGLITGD